MKKIFFILICILATATVTLANDSPHANDVACDYCHSSSDVSGGVPSPFWGTHTPSNLEDTSMNLLCTGCHDQPAGAPSAPTTAMSVRTHTSRATSTTYGDWTVECVACHNPHYQRQYVYYRNLAPIKLAQGTVNTIALDAAASLTYGIPVSRITFTLNVPGSKAGWTDPAAWVSKSAESRGAIIYPNSTNVSFSFSVLEKVDATTILVRGDVGPGLATVPPALGIGKTFMVTYGQAVKEKIYAPGKTSATTYRGPTAGDGIAGPLAGSAVKFFDKTLTNSFAINDLGGATDTTKDGICQVCHTQTAYWRSDGSRANHNSGANCTTCHPHSEGFKAMGCDQCHGYPPIDSSTLVFKDKLGGPITSQSPGPGAHQKHKDKGFVCTNCHTEGMTSASTGDYKVNIGFNLGGNLGGNYDGKSGRTDYNVIPDLVYDGKGTTTVSVNNTLQCSSLYCHSTGQSNTGGALAGPDYKTPAWTGAALNCGSCHENMDSSASATGSHIKHAQTEGIACAACHNGYTEASTASTHVDKSINLSFSGAAAGTTYAQGNTHAAGSNGYSTCTSLCHNDGTNTLAKVTPAWGAAVAACAACHAAVPATGSHSTHLAVSGIACGKCHGDAVQSTTVPTGVHLNAKVNVYDVAAGDFGVNYGAAGKDRGTPYSTCLSINCHGTSSPAWGAGYAAYDSCTVCHGEKTTAADGATIAGANPEKVAPGGAGTDTGGNSDATLSRVGAHQTHLLSSNNYTTNILCSECHTVPAAFGDSGHIDATLAWDGHATVDFPGNATNNRARKNGATPSYNATSGECSGVYCHGSNMPNSSNNGTGTTPVWNNTAYLTGTPATAGDCGKCHGAPPTGYAPTSHTGSETIAQCAGCHDHFNADGTVKVARIADHMDGTVQAAACTDCHGQPPVSAGTLVTKDSGGVTSTGHVQGAHSAHWTVFSGSGCGICHAGGGTSDAGHMSAKQITIGFTYGQSAGTFNTTAYSSTFTAFSGDAGTTVNNAQASITCSSVYCHGSNMGGNGGTNQTPNWTGGASQAACGTCHGASAAAAPTLGKHTKHASSTGYSFSCDLCHPAVSGGAHVNANVAWSISTSDARTNGGTYKTLASGSTGAIAPSGTYGSCATLYCHSNANPSGGTNSYSTVAWDGIAMTCGSCHKTTDTAANMSTAGTPQPMSARHIKHMATDEYGQNANFTCNTCHNDTASDNTTISDKTKHVNAAKDVAFNTNIGGSWSGTQCTNTYCHSNGTAASGTHAAISWAGSGSLPCSGCHGGGSSLFTNAHGSHLYPTGVGPNTGRAINCGDCHIVTAGDATSVSSKINHNNKLINIRFDNLIAPIVLDGDAPKYNGTSTTGTGMTKAPGLAIASCENVYCHSVGNLANNTGSGAVVAVGTPSVSFHTIAWDGGAIGCNGCHGDTTNPNKAHPVYTSGGAGTTSANSHVKHVETSSYSCDYCHNTTTTNTTIPPTTVLSNISEGGHHLDRKEDVSFKLNGGLTGTYNAAVGTKTCSTTYCHGTGTPQWGGVVNCGDCHAANNTLPLSHATHYGVAANGDRTVDTKVNNTGAYVFQCGSCHSGVAHANGTKEVAMSGTWSGTMDGSKTCSSVYCHSDGNGGAGGTPQWAVSTMTCGSCHAAQPATARHTKHVNDATYNFKCYECHAVTATNAVDASVAINDKYQHVDKTKDVDWGTLSSGGTAYVNAATNCSNIYCHSDGKTASAPFGAPKTAVAWGTAYTATCTSCHDDANATTTLSGAHEAHTFGATATVGRNLTCEQCHNDTVSNSTTISSYTNHINKVKDIKVAIDNTACNNIQCHSNGNFDGTVSYNNPAWTDSLGCTSCHGDGVSKAYPSYADGGNGTGASNSHNAHIASSGIGCGQCHTATTTAGISIDGTTPANHVNQTVEVTFSQGGTYNGVPNTAITETCSTTYCHGTAASPAWGAVGATNCASCHGASNAMPGKHGVHYATSTTATSAANTPGNNSTAGAYIFTCGKCHNSTTHAGGIAGANQAAEVSLSGGGTYTPAGTSAGSDNGFSYTAGTCSTNECHQNGSGGAPNTASYTWTGTLPGNCIGCHNNNVASGAVMSSGRHTAHVSDTTIMTPKACNTCHTVTVDATDRAIADKRVHANGTKNVDILGTYDSDATPGNNWNSGTVTCSNVYCHSDGQATPTYKPIVWTATISDCVQCHGGAGTTTTLTGSHLAHIGTDPSDTNKQFGYTCNNCHEDTATNNTTIGTPANHINKLRDVSVTVANGGTGTIGGDFSSGSCATTNCHGTASPVWATGATNGNCTACHGMVASATDDRDTSGAANNNSDPQIGAHEAHLNASHGYSAPIACTECHNTTVTNMAVQTTYVAKVNAAGHIDSTLPAEATFGTLAVIINGGSGVSGYASSNCSNVYCHDYTRFKRGYADDASLPNANRTPTWNSPILTGTQADCQACHGFPPALPHPQNSNCASCHNHVIGTNDGFTIAGKLLHVNGVTDGGGDNCSDCHSAAGGATAGTSPDATHAKHVGTYYVNGKVSTNDYGSTNANWLTVNVNSATGEYQFGCGNCHPMDVAKHIDGIVNVTLNNTHGGTVKAKNNVANDTTGYTQNNTTPGSQAGDSVTCSAAYCHSNGYTTTKVFATTPDWYGGSFSGDKCANCHGNSPNAVIAGSASHASHVVGIHYKDIYSGTTGKLTQGATTNAAHGNSASSTTINCNVCHSDTVTAATNDKNSVCTTCHNGTDATLRGNGVIASRLTHVNGAVDVNFGTFSIKSKAQLRDDITSVAELNSSWTRSAGGYKNATIDNSYDSSKRTPTYLSGTCSTVDCHNGYEVSWTATNVSCTSCHTGLPK